MKKIIACFLLMSLNWVMAQNNVAKHKVAKGETITKIAQKYSVTPLDIYRLNPDAQAGISENTLLIIPKKGNTPVVKSVISTSKKHTVASKETWYSIAKLYGFSVTEIQNANPEITNGLSIGQVVNIPSKKVSVKAPENKKQEPVFHEVKAKETKYSIAKQYGITVEELEKKNPEIVNGLPIGFVLLIKGERPKVQPPVSVPVPVVPAPVSDKKGEYVVKAQETLYGLAHQFGVTQEELIALNPELKEGVRDGMVIIIPSKTLIAVKKEYVDLTKSLKKQGNRKVALLLPFNIDKLDQDTVNSTKSRLKKDKFLNMTLEFYSGVLEAIDSINKLGVDVDVTILDSEETKSTSNVANLIREKNLKSFDAVIGPFYQNHVEKAAEILETVPVFSPLSKDYDKKYPNLIQATPSNDDIKNAMFDFIRTKGGNMVAIVDPKKQSIKEFITTNHKDVQLVNFTDKGVLDVAHLKSLFVAGKENFVIMETEKTNLILSITTNLLNLQKQFDIKLVILGENEALDFDEIQMSRLTKLKMHYPSQTRENKSPKGIAFEKEYRKLNKVYPSAFATRGFDVTFDVLLRLAQENPLAETLNNVASEAIENRFNYVQNPDGGFTNKGVHILYYDTDLTIKEAK